MPIYIFFNKAKNKNIEVQLAMSKVKSTYKDTDGTICQRVFTTPNTFVKRGQQVYDKYPQVVKKSNPKTIKLNSGKKVKYNKDMHKSDVHPCFDRPPALPPTGKYGQSVFVNDVWYKWDGDSWVEQ